MTTTSFVESIEKNKFDSGSTELLSQQCGPDRVNNFALFYLIKRFQIPSAEATKFVDLTGNEFGIDGFYHDSRNRTLFLFEFSFSEDHLSFKDCLEKLALVGIPNIFCHASISEQYESKFPARLQEFISENREKIDRIIIHPVFRGDVVRAEKSKVLDSLREYIESKKYIIDDHLGRQVDIVFQVISSGSRLRSSHAFLTKQSLSYTIPFESSLTVQNEYGDELVVTFIPVITLYKMFSDLGDRFFEKNIRCGVNNGKMTTQEIRKSLRKVLADQEPVENFTFYHNGVTLTAQKVELQRSKHSLTMTEPRLLNGVQTVKTVKKYVDENSRRRVRLERVLEKVRVMARIVVSKEEEFLRQVTISNNRQNPIMPWNLRANDLMQLHFEDMFREKLGIYYERRENALEDLSDQELEEMNIASRKTIRIRKLAQTLLALHGDVDRISQTKEVFESDKWYHNTFREKYLSVDLRKILLIYKVHFRLGSIVKEIHDLGSEKHDYVGKIRNLVWCLVIQGLLNYNSFDKSVQEFGNSLATEANFNTLLRDIASIRLRFILRDTFGDRKYRDALSQSKYSFLKTKVAFNDCMHVATKQFGWEKKDL